MALATEIEDSTDLARLLTDHAHAASDGEPRPQWETPAVVDSLRFYEIDTVHSSDTRCVLKGTNAAAEYKTEYHSCPLHENYLDISKPHWCPAIYATEHFLDGEATVTRDWRSVSFGHAAHLETDTFDTLEAAQAKYDEHLAYCRDYESRLWGTDVVWLAVVGPVVPAGAVEAAAGNITVPDEVEEWFTALDSDDRDCHDGLVLAVAFANDDHGATDAGDVIDVLHAELFTTDVPALREALGH